MNYIRISEGLNKYELVPEDINLDKYISERKSYEKDYYVSLFKYNKEQYAKWKQTKTVAGIKDVITERIFLDFDDEIDPTNAQRDALIAVDKIVALGIPKENIQLAFSGNKGFSVEFKVNQTLTPDEFKKIAFNIGETLPTFDKVVNDPQRIVRVIGTKHQKSGLYKYPLTLDQLRTLPIDDIKELASDLSSVDDTKLDYSKWDIPCAIPESLMVEKENPFKEAVEKVDHELDLSLKPRWLTPAKYALQEGYITEGNRSVAFMILASTYKNQGFNDDIVYRMLKGVAERESRRNQRERYSDKELWNNIVKQVFSPTWQGGQYAKDHPLLKETTIRLGLPTEKDDKLLVGAEDVSSIFKSFAENIDKNTMKLGIPKIDENVRITTSMVVGLLGAPSSGKTTLAINFLNYASLNGVKSIFFSLDMGAPLVFQRLIQRHKSLTSDKVFTVYRNKDAAMIKEIEDEVVKNYVNTKFSYKTGLTVEDLRQAVVDEQERTGEKVKLVVVDYLECISGPYSDATANTALIAQKLKDIANDLELTLVLLLQPQKHAGDPSDELLSYRNIKGSSAVEQAASIVLSVWRPGFSAKHPQNDRYLSMAVLKNRMGGLSQFDFKWNGLTGTITELDHDDDRELEQIREAKYAEKSSDGGF